ncbi:hypothetical protein Q9233_008180 [Columba guinea]|nr:hypothetical protein Q9233_008180 [Columba guinea]
MGHWASRRHRRQHVTDSDEDVTLRWRTGWVGDDDTNGLSLQGLGPCQQPALVASIPSPFAHGHHKLPPAQQHLFLLGYGRTLFFLHDSGCHTCHCQALSRGIDDVRRPLTLTPFAHATATLGDGIDAHLLFLEHILTSFVIQSPVFLRGVMATMKNDFFIAEGMAPPQRIFFPLEKICMALQHNQRAGAGLHNVDNPCFLSSILQCLMYTTLWPTTYSLGSTARPVSTSVNISLASVSDQVKKAVTNRPMSSPVTGQITKFVRFFFHVKNCSAASCGRRAEVTIAHHLIHNLPITPTPWTPPTPTPWPVGKSRLVVFHQVFPIPHLYLFPQTHEMADKHLTCPMVAQEEDRAPQESSSPAEPQELCMAQDLEMVVAEGMAPPQRILFPPEKICMAWQHSQRAGAGLHNLGNTCFLNSVLQCLTYTPPLANHLLSGEHSRACGQKGFCVMCRMEVHVQQVLHSSASAIEPWAVVDFLTEIGENFQHGRQEDAHEFLRCTMDAMQRACLRGNSDLDMSSQATTIIHQIFGGFLRSRVTCWSCQAVSNSYEAFLDVPLDIKPLALSWLSRCDKMTAASKRFTVHRAPKVLTVCLKRFEAFTGDKISKVCAQLECNVLFLKRVSQSRTLFHKLLMLRFSRSLLGTLPVGRQVVEYPQYLDLRPYMSQAAGEPLLYSLYAVLVHGGGSCRAGHYFCYIKASDGLWYHMNDKSVDLCDSDTVLRQQAYLLFYIRYSDLEVGQRASSSPAPPEARSLLSQWAAGSKQVRSVAQQHLPHRTKAAVGR